MTDERDRLLAMLDGLRSSVLHTIDGLTDRQLRTPVLPSGWHFLGMVKHLAISDERYWFSSIVGGEPIEDFDDGEDWRVDDSESAASIVDLYRHEIERANAVIRSTDIDQPPRQPDPTWETWGVTFPDLRKVMYHVILETSRHAGHLDAARELVDGRQTLVLG